MSITLTVPPISAETKSLEPSGVYSREARAASPTSTFATISKLPVSIRCAMFVVSEVLTTILPSGLTPIPSGSTPTGTSASTCRVSTSTTVTMLSSSLAM